MRKVTLSCIYTNYVKYSTKFSNVDVRTSNRSWLIYKENTLFLLLRRDIYQNNITKWPNNNFNQQKADKILIIIDTTSKISISIKKKLFGFPQ